MRIQNPSANGAERGKTTHRLVELREILRYVPQYRDKVFVIAFDGAIVEHENFRNLLLDLALLRSLRIGVVLIHGAGHQIGKLAKETGATATNLDGTGVTDSATMQLALTAANRLTHELLEGLSVHDLRGACSNAVVAHPAGILQGVDQQYTGRIDRIDATLLKALLASDIVPIVPPLGFDGEGATYRLNSDNVAVEVARTLEAVKLIYLTTVPGVVQGNTLVRQLTVDEAELLLKKSKNDLIGPSLSKLSGAVKALRGGVPRVHIIDGTVEEGLLAEVFSNDGIGTLVHTNAYQAIRKAQKKDSRGIHQLIKNSVENEELLPRTLAEIERQIGDYFIFEVDGNLAGCIALHPFAEDKKAEMACVCVSGKYENQGIGARLMQYTVEQARQSGFEELFCLSTQAVNYLVKKGNFQLGTPEDLPPTRRQRYDTSGRRSQVLKKALQAPG
ncbi:MAG TPA: amino-acid N-acetyltransferase [Gemmataceae bacterium]|nr:amino-acid N-acetyltransferase [Gemmataceae bacterium]